MRMEHPPDGALAAAILLELVHFDGFTARRYETPGAYPARTISIAEASWRSPSLSAGWSPASAARDSAAGVKSLVHVSAIGADPAAPSAYGQSKAAGEAAVLETLPDAVVMRPSLMFGPQDHFFNRFAGLARFAPVFPLIGGGHTRMQPVFAGDVARAIADTLEGKAEPGKVYELGGPEVKTLRECIEFALAEADRRRLLLPLPWPLAGA